MPHSCFRAVAFLAAACLASASVALRAADASAPGLLFYLSADKGTTADVAAPGTAVPTFVSEVTTIPNGFAGPALSCGNLQRLAWSAPGNIRAQRGTLAFFWRARDPVGPTEFPVFRVGYADHSSWDMVWLRIDYNGHGFDAFVTDASLSRTRVSTTLQPFPSPDTWIHLAFSWDETRGVRLYVNGKLAAQKDAVAVYDAGLDQFGPHSRIISPYQVQSDYNFTRGGDIDELRIYDRMLDDAAIASLARNVTPALPPLAARSLTDPTTRAEWDLRYGFNRTDDPPPALPPGPTVRIRKVEIHDAFDLGRWWWKATDGIRETTWPGVYNRSRLAGRNDYFQLPDWDCYVDSGKAITFQLPDEPWNHLEISGAAWGKLELLKPGTALEKASGAPVESLLFDRPRGQETTSHALSTRTGGQIRFTNAEQEQPIGELSAYLVEAGAEPKGSQSLAYHLGYGAGEDRFVSGRFPADERAALVARPVGTSLVVPSMAMPVGHFLPLVHVFVPLTDGEVSEGLDGIALDLPALNLPPTNGGLIALNIQIKDPTWPSRDLLNLTFSVKPGDARTLWLDTRDRILPKGKPLYLTIACASADFGAGTLFDARLRLVFKSREAARPEHELDRFTQARDAYAMLVEEHPNSPKFALWARFKGDLEDLLRVNPEHNLGRKYAVAALPGSPRPPFVQPAAPAGAPLWAFRQTELLGRVKKFVTWYIDHRQSTYGDFGGGISDDVDLTNTWPGVALMGSEPAKIKLSLQRLLDAAYKNGMFTRGLPTIQADELHSYEEGINCLAQNLILDYGSPRQLERAMENIRGVAGITGVNTAGHRHIRSSYYSGTKVAEEGPWGWSKPYSYLALHPAYLFSDYNGNPTSTKLVTELAAGLLAHYHTGEGRGGLPAAIQFSTDAEGEATRGMLPWPLFWSAWRATGDRKFLAPITDNGLSGLAAVNANVLDLLSLRADWRKRLGIGERAESIETRRPDGGTRSADAGFRTSTMAHFTWQLNGDKRSLESLYASQIEQCANLEFINTEGSLWIDRVAVPHADLQRARLGGVALLRNALYPGHTVSWEFAAPATDQSVAILVPDATPTAFKVIAHNLESTSVHAAMTGWDIAPGVWEIAQGVDTNDDDLADAAPLVTTATFERTRTLTFTLPPHATTILTLKLKTPGTPYWKRPDLGLDREDVTRTATGLRVKLHSLGSVASPVTTVALLAADGRTVATATVPVLEAPLDLFPRTTDVTLSLPKGTALEGLRIEIDPEHRLTEITTRNNMVGNLHLLPPAR